MIRAILIGLLCVPAMLHANVVSTPTPNVEVKVDSSLFQRVCYYEDRAYSLGAILKVGDYYMVCKAENSYETNGKLKWYPLDYTTQN